MWEQRIKHREAIYLRLDGLPARIQAELAWMAHWQFLDGCKIPVSKFNVAAVVIHWMLNTKRCRVESVLDIDSETFTRQHRGWCQSHRAQFPATASATDIQHVLYGYPRFALIARMNDGPWWTLDEWIPRCDPRIPLRDREPRRSDNCRPGQAQVPWMREAIKWHLGTALEAGTLTWTSIPNRCCELLLFDRWLSRLNDPATVCGTIADVSLAAASFRRWASDPANRTRSAIKRSASPGTVNNSLRAVANLMAFIADNRSESRRLIGPSPWDDLTDAHPLIWRKQITRTRSVPRLSDENYVDDHALSQIVASLPVLGADPTETVTVRVGDTERELAGCGDPQTTRMLLLQI